MPQLDMLSWLNQGLTTMVVMFFFYALLALVFLSNMFKGRTTLIKELYIVNRFNKFHVLLLLLTFFFWGGVDNFDGLYTQLSFHPSIVLLSGKGSSSGLSPKATVKKSSTGAQDTSNDGSSYDADDDHAWPEEVTDLWDFLPPSGGSGNTVARSSATTVNDSNFQAHEFATGPTETTNVGYYGRGPVNHLLELCGYTKTETQNAAFAAKTEEAISICLEEKRLAYLEGVKDGEALAVAKMAAANTAWKSALTLILAKIMLLFLLTVVFDYILSVILYKYFYKKQKFILT